MSSSLLLILTLLAVLYFWFSSARAREFATGVASELCERRGYQLLDGTVALRRLGIGRSDAGMQLRRVFSFDYSVEGHSRRQGFVLMLGNTVTGLDFREPEPPRVEPTAETPDHNAAASSTEDRPRRNNVVPFRRR